MPDIDTYQRLIDLFDTTRTPYRLIDHKPDGTTDSVSALRGHPVSHAAKCIILRVKIDRRTTCHVLAVVPGDRRVDLDAVRALFNARYVGFSDPATAERLAHAVPGTVLPFAFDPDLELVTDPEVVARTQLYFNAARLDRHFRCRLRTARPAAHRTHRRPGTYRSPRPRPA
ncbi:YbaK/EbsC family protein [Streptomyces sp. NPDC055749]